MKFLLPVLIISLAALPHAMPKNIQKALTARILKSATEGEAAAMLLRDADAAVAKTAAIKNIQKALTARILKSYADEEDAAWLLRDADAAVAKTAAIKNIQKALTARILKIAAEGEDAEVQVQLRDDKAAAVAKTAAIKNIQKALTARILKSAVLETEDLNARQMQLSKSLFMDFENLKLKELEAMAEVATRDAPPYFNEPTWNERMPSASG